MTERRLLTVTGPDGPLEVEATIATEPPWSLALAFGDGSVAEADAEDLFAALEAIRLQLEPSRLRVCCQGARPDVFPSGMARQAGGRRAYRLRPGQRPTSDDLVDIFDPADCREVVTVQKQQAAVRRLRRPRSHREALETAAGELRKLDALQPALRAWRHKLTFGEYLDGIDRIVQVYLPRERPREAVVLATVRVPPEGEAVVAIHQAGFEQLSRLDPTADDQLEGGSSLT